MTTADESVETLHAIYVGIITTTIRSFFRIPGFPQSYREKLQAYLLALKDQMDPDQLSRFSRAIETIINEAIAEIVPDSRLDASSKELNRIIATLDETVQTMAHANSSAGTTLQTQLGALQKTITESDDSATLSRKLDGIASGIREAVSSLSQELQQSREQVEQAGGKIKTLEQQLESAKAESMLDGLTGLNNRRAFNLFVEETFSSYDVRNPWAGVLFDIDHFKMFNDMHGHLIGDALLLKIAKTLMEKAPESAFVARYGGEEFVMMITAQSLVHALQVIERIQTSVRSARWRYESNGRKINVSATISAGVALQKPTDTAESLIERADRALYLAKNEGRDRTRSELDL